MTNAIVLTPEKALLDLTLLNAESVSWQFDDVFIDGLGRGLPPELLTRLHDLWDSTQVVAGEVVAIGRIVVDQIAKFLKANSGLTIGMALGAAIGALVAAIPLIGPILAPISALLMALYGGGVGAANSEKGGRPTISPFDAAVALARKFFELFAGIINAVAGYWSR